MEETVLEIAENPLISGKCFYPEKEEDQAVLKILRDLDELYFQENKPLYWEYRMSLKLNELWLETTVALAERKTTCSLPGKRIMNESRSCWILFIEITEISLLCRIFPHLLM